MLNHLDFYLKDDLDDRNALKTQLYTWRKWFNPFLGLNLPESKAIGFQDRFVNTLKSHIFQF